MKRNVLSLIAMAALVASGTLTSTLLAQGGAPVGNPNPQPAAPATAPANAPPIPVMVVDFLYLMEIHPELYAVRNTLIQESQKAETGFQAEVQQLQNKGRELQGPAPGTAEYTAKKEELLRLQADLELRARSHSEKLQMQLMTAQYNAFVDIKYFIDYYARQNNVLLVINSIDVKRRLPAEKSLDSQAMEMEQVQLPVVCFQPQMDMTRVIEGWLDQQYVQSGKFTKVDYNKIKEQMFGPQRSGAAPTQIANPGGQQVQPR